MRFVSVCISVLSFFEKIFIKLVYFINVYTILLYNISRDKVSMVLLRETHYVPLRRVETQRAFQSVKTGTYLF